VSSAQILVLGAIAGFTIFLGLPLGRVQSPDARLRAALSGLATGILLFLLYDVLAHGVGPVEESLEEAVSDGGSWGEFVGLAADGRRAGRRPDEPRLLRPVGEEPARA
jgi:ZIP family zinc transporter